MEGSWHRSLAEAVRSRSELCQLLKIDHRVVGLLEAPDSGFPVLVPRSYVRRMEVGNPRDPLLLQVIPQAVESVDVAGFVADPVADTEFRIAPGLLRKYATRALLITTGSCAVHCRYCFRRHYPYGDDPKRVDDWGAAIEALRAATDIDEVILSGGDPLMLNDQRLSDLLSRLASIPHLTRVRVHSRLPIVLPDRVTDDLIAVLTGTRLTPIMVVHANHANELIADCATALRRLVRSGITTLNQAVLLRGVNDSVTTQVELCRTLVNLGVLPYYLHQLDRVAGAAHFEAEADLGCRIIRELRRQLPGYAVPRFVQERPGESHKFVLE